MNPLISCQDIEKSHGSRELFHNLSVALFSGDRVGLVGPNGAGKSTLLKILAGMEQADDGRVTRGKGITVGYVTQQVEELEGSVEEVVLRATESMQSLTEQERYARVRQTLGALGFSDLQQSADELSGGRKRRLTIARALVNEPDILLLDEPTNHLDLESILWLEGFLQRKQLTFVITSHDRAFLDNVCNKMWEISHRYPNGIFQSEGCYSDFLEIRAAFLEGQQEREKSLRSKMRREDEWLRQSPKARTTKSRSRIQQAARLKHELAQVKMRNRESKSQFELSDTGRQTKKLIWTKGVSKSLGEKQLFDGLDLTLYRGERLGIVGENGCGKSTLLKVLSGDLEPDSGTVHYADNLKVNLFDQHREQLDLTQTLRRGLAPDGDTVKLQGHSIHVNSWGERFLFPKERLDLPMSKLSGGERARVLIARMMAQPADLLLLDEPTNDLDIETLEVLEESLDDFPGVVILITHDRAMMDRVADKLITVKGTKFDDTESWLEARPKPAAPVKKVIEKVAKPKKSLTYNEQRELGSIERRIGKLEAEKERVSERLEDPAIASDPGKLQEQCGKIAALDNELNAAYERWQELEDKR